MPSDSARHRRRPARVGPSRCPARPRRSAPSARRATGSGSSRTTPRGARARSRRSCAALGFELAEEELETTPVAAARAARGLARPRARRCRRSTTISRRTSSSSSDDADVVLIGGADESEETGRGLRLGAPERAFAELERGARLVLPAPQPLVADGRRAAARLRALVVAGLEYAAGVEAEVVGKPSPAYFEAALEALDASARGDDDGRRRRRRGHRRRAKRLGPRRPSSSAPGSSGRTRWRAAELQPDAVLDSVADLPAWLAERSESAVAMRVGIDLIEIARVRRALARHASFASGCSRRPSAPTATRGRTRRSTTPRASPARRRSARRSAAAPSGAGARSRSPAGPSRACGSRAGRQAWAERVGAGPIDLSMTHSRELAAAIASSPTRLSALEPLYTAAEMRAAEAGFGRPTLELMERAGAAATEAVLRRFPHARRISVWCGAGANGGDGLVVARLLHEAGREPEVVLAGPEEKLAGDAAENLRRAYEAGVRFAESPIRARRRRRRALRHRLLRASRRREAAARIEALRALEAPVVSIDVPSGSTPRRARWPAPAVQAARDRDVPRAQGRARRRARALPRRRGRGRRHRARARPRRGTGWSRPRSSRSSRAAASGTTSTARASSCSSAARPG